MITLTDVFTRDCVLKSGIIGESLLIGKLEVYGYVNSIDDDELLDLVLDDVLSGEALFKNSDNQNVLSNHILQYNYSPKKRNTVTENYVAPIFKEVKIAKKADKYDIRDLYIPSIAMDVYYKRIKSRDNRFTPTEQGLRYHKFPDNIHMEDGVVTYTSEVGDFLFLDKDRVIKGIGEKVMAVCRYIHRETGKMCYTLYDLDEIMISDESNN